MQALLLIFLCFFSQGVWTTQARSELPLIDSTYTRCLEKRDQAFTLPSDCDQKILSLISEFIYNKSAITSFSVQNDLITLCDEANKRVSFIFKKPQHDENYTLADREIAITLFLFNQPRFFIKDEYCIFNCSYFDSRLFPDNRAQALALLCFPYGLLNKTIPPLDCPLNALQKKVISCKNDTTFSTVEGLAGNTIIQTKNGYCTIDQLKIGDEVVTCHERNKRQCFRRVTHIEKETVDSYIKIIINEKTFGVAHGTQFNIAPPNTMSLLWITAQRLAYLPEAWPLVDPSFKECKEIKEPLEIYRISIDETHNFCITQQNILVHNFDIVIAGAVYWGADITWEIAKPTLLAMLGICGYKLYNTLRDIFCDDDFAFKSKVIPLVGSKDINDILLQHEVLLSKCYDEKVPQQQNKKSSILPQSNKGNSSDPDENPKRGPVEYITTAVATAIAEALGFKKTKYTSMGRPVFQQGKQFITPDRKAHNGGFWKKAYSIEDFNTRGKRIGTFDKTLSKRIGD